MAINRSVLIDLALSLTMIVAMSSSVAHCYTQQNDAVSSSSNSSGEFTLPIVMIVRVFGLVTCAAPALRPPSSEPLVAHVDIIAVCDVNRIATGQTTTQPSGAFYFAFNITSMAMSEPVELTKCRVIARFPGGACVADLVPVNTVLEKVVVDGHTYYVSEYKAQQFRPYYY